MADKSVMTEAGGSIVVHRGDAPALGRHVAVVDPQADILASLRALEVATRKQAIAIADGRNQFAALERENAKSRRIIEQLLGEALTTLDELKAESRRLSERLQAAEVRNGRLMTRLALQRAAKSPWRRFSRIFGFGSMRSDASDGR